MAGAGLGGVDAGRGGLGAVAAGAGVSGAEVYGTVDEDRARTGRCSSVSGSPGSRDTTARAATARAAAPAVRAAGRVSGLPPLPAWPGPVSADAARDADADRVAR